MLQTKVVENIKTHILCSIFFFENRAVNEIMWKNIVELHGLQITIRRKRIGFSIPKATDTHPQYATVIVFSLQ